MKKKYTITFTVDANYPYIDSADKHAAKLSRDFDKYLKEYVGPDSETGKHIVPALFEPSKHGAVGHDANGTVRVKIVRDKEVILDTWWDVLSKDF